MHWNLSWIWAALHSHKPPVELCWTDNTDYFTRPTSMYAPTRCRAGISMSRALCGRRQDAHGNWKRRRRAHSFSGRGLMRARSDGRGPYTANTLRVEDTGRIRQSVSQFENIIGMRCEIDPDAPCERLVRRHTGKSPLGHCIAHHPPHPRVTLASWRKIFGCYQTLCERHIRWYSYIAHRVSPTGLPSVTRRAAGNLHAVWILKNLTRLGRRCHLRCLGSGLREWSWDWISGLAWLLPARWTRITYILRRMDSRRISIFMPRILRLRWNHFPKHGLFFLLPYDATGKSNQYGRRTL